MASPKAEGIPEVSLRKLKTKFNTSGGPPAGPRFCKFSWSSPKSACLLSGSTVAAASGSAPSPGLYKMECSPGL